jgi:LysM repeat protein
MKTKLFQTKRRAQSGFRTLYAKTRKRRKQRVSATANSNDFSVEEPNLGVARALVVILILHLAAIAAIVVHHNTTKKDSVVDDGPSQEQASKATASAVQERARIDPQSDKWHWVDRGETYERIARAEQVDVAELRRLNNNAPLAYGAALLLPSKRDANTASSANVATTQESADPPSNEALPPIVEAPPRPGLPAEYEVVAEAQLVDPPRQQPSVQQSLPQRQALPIEQVSNRSSATNERPKPTPSPQKSYAVKSGDTIWAIANRNGISSQQLLSANPGVNPKNLKIGSTLVIPAN